MANPDIAKLKATAREGRVQIIRMLTHAGSGHPGGSLSVIDILTVLYFNRMKYDARNPRWEDRDRFVLSKGHCVPAQYFCMAKAGYFPESLLLTLRKLGSPLQGHPDRMALPGIEAAIVDETGHDVPNGQGGLLVVKRPWPSMIRTIWGDPERFKKSYYPAELGGHLYLAGDGSIRDKKTGYFTIVGRIDDVLNVAGHRMGTMEIESALVANPLVAEAAVVGRPDDMTGEAICAFVVLKQARPSDEHAPAIAKQLRDWVAKEIGPIAKPRDIRFGDNLPKTRSGKIMRRLLRSIAKGEEIKQDVSTLENPAILDQLKIVQ